MQIFKIVTKNKRLFSGLIFTLLLSYNGSLYGAASPPALFFFSDNVQGETEPCG